MEYGGAIMIETTLALIKPDAVAAGHAPEILRIMGSKFRIASVHAAQWTPDAVAMFYAEHAERPFFEDLKTFMSSDIMYSVVLRAPNAVKAWRELVGPTDPKAAPFHTLRCTYGDHNGPVMRNAVHGSDSRESATREIRTILDLIRVGLIRPFGV